MPKRKIKRAIISVYDKTGIVDFAKALSAEFGIEIISTGGTAKLLKENNVPVTLVEEVTGFPEMMDGRVKTLHPKIHAGILADRDNPEHMRQLEEQGIKPIDMVVVNLYAFEKTIADPTCTFEQAIEMIDIGGPCMLRAAAKNHKHVLVCEYSWQWYEALDELRDYGGCFSEKLANENAAFVFGDTTNYDHLVSNWLYSKRVSVEDDGHIIRLINGHVLRYGENPHQMATYYGLYDDDNFNRLICAVGGPSSDLSYNNINDAASAYELCNELATHRRSGREQFVVVFVKHTNPCGVGIGSSPIDAYRSAYLGDPNAAMGGVLACSFPVDLETALEVMETFDRYGRKAGAGGFFAEIWLAPSFVDDKVVNLIRSHKPWGARVRLLDTGEKPSNPVTSRREYQHVTGGMLVQTRDTVGLNEDQWKVVTDCKPTDQELNDLRLAWLICKHTKSNAITLCKDNMLIGNGAGQMSRVMSCRIATWLAKDNGHEGKLKGSVAASDAFFPFSDGPDILMEAGVSAIIQPGGSKRDEDTIKACNERGVAMIHTGTRHFKH